MIFFSPGEKAAGVGVVDLGAFCLAPSGRDASPRPQPRPGHRFLILGLYLQLCQRADGAAERGALLRAPSAGPVVARARSEPQKAAVLGPVLRVLSLERVSLPGGQGREVPSCRFCPRAPTFVAGSLGPMGYF